MRRPLRSSAFWGATTATAAFVLGFLGYRHVDPPLNVADALFRCLQLFSLDVDVFPGMPWELNVARFLAALSLGLATVAALGALLGSRTRDMARTRSLRDHVVVLGVDSWTRRLAQSLVKDGVPTVVLDPAPDVVAALRAEDLLAWTGPVDDVRQWRLMRVERAAHVVVSAPDDVEALQLAEKVRALTPAAEGGRIHVAVRDVALVEELGRVELGGRRGAWEVDVLSPLDRAGLVLAAEVESAIGPRPEGLVVHGEGTLLDRTLVHLVRRYVCDGHRLEVSRSERRGWPRLVASADDGAALTTALACARRDPAPVLCLQDRDLTSIVEALGAPPHLHLLSVASTTDLTVLEMTGRELMAWARHEDYVAQQRQHGETVETNPSLRPWAELPESLRRSNRAFAASVADYLAQVGASLVPLGEATTYDAALVSDDALEDLARQEHDRWADALAADGWTYGQGPKDPVARTHPLLVPWEDLAEAERQKDRDGILAIPRMLARVGYAVRL